jgi:16S rRNA (cytidine1402-2'-O)-methyltransferase
LAEQDVVLVSDAWTPGLSDPGKLLIKVCNEQSLEYSVLPGANALVPAIVAAGFDTSDFRFVWFLPKKKGKQTLIKEILAAQVPTFFYESVHRVEKTLQYFIDLWATGTVSLARELSKKHEQYATLNIAEMLEWVQEWKIVLKGEFVMWYYPAK